MAVAMVSVAAVYGAIQAVRRMVRTTHTLPLLFYYSDPAQFEEGANYPGRGGESVCVCVCERPRQHNDPMSLRELFKDMCDIF